MWSDNKSVCYTNNMKNYKKYCVENFLHFGIKKNPQDSHTYALESV